MKDREFKSSLCFLEEEPAKNHPQNVWLMDPATYMALGNLYSPRASQKNGQVNHFTPRKTLGGSPQVEIDLMAHNF